MRERTRWGSLLSRAGQETPAAAGRIRHGARPRLVPVARVVAALVGAGGNVTGRLAGLLLVAALARRGLPGGSADRRTAAPGGVDQPADRARGRPTRSSSPAALAAVERVEVRARVSGYITKVAFADGALVKHGDLLFEIDPREYQAAVVRAEGEIARLRAVARAGGLGGRPHAAPATVGRGERARGGDGDRVEGGRRGRAQVGASRSSRRRSLDLEFTRVVAPIAGRVEPRRAHRREPGRR